MLAVDVFLAVRASFQLTTGIVNNRLPPCPGKANCVSSDAADKMHRIAPYRLKTAARDAWHGLQDAVAAERRITLIEVSDSYLHVEVRSAVMRFVDDTEFELRIEEGIIAVRSAARTGSSDVGVNRRRVERIRNTLQTRGLVE